MASRKSVKKAKKSFAAKAVIGGVCVCVLAAVIGFASSNMLTPNQVSMGLGSSGSFKARITVSSDITPPSASNATAQAGQSATAAQEAGASSGSTDSEDDTNEAGAQAATGMLGVDSSSTASIASGTASSASGASATASSANATTTDVFANAFARRTALNDLAPLNATADFKTLSDRIKQQRREEEEARLAAERVHIQEVQAKQRAYGGESAVAQVDFSVGEEAFVEEWTQRIDAYLAGSNLAGHGCDFAQAAWDYGVDPRWSPAISNTESGKGAHCFLPHNAWGWGASIWFNWTDAIYAHVKGLADGYGYSITYSAAAKYCPPNTANWYNNTLGEMAKM